MTQPQSERFTPALGALMFLLTPLAAHLSIAAANVESSGPVLSSSEIARGAILLHFNHTESGLVLKTPGRGAFKIAGADHVWFPAEAHLVNGVVVVSTSLVQEPAAVRYDWSRSADAALFNSAGLPARSFRTDK